MADPFEVRMRFTSQLQHLNASVSSAQKAAQYAIKYKEMDEDLHSCILEQVERNNMNTRANIMYFIEHFLDIAQKEGHADYIRMMQRDIIRVVDAVAPDDGSGAANVRVVRKVLQGLQGKGYLDTQVVVQIQDVIKERETTTDDLELTSPPNGDADTASTSATAAANYSSSSKSSAQAAAVAASHSASAAAAAPPSSSSKSSRRGPPHHRLDKRQIEQRIEEDRERHKRERENIWAVPGGADAEMTKLWDETSDYGGDDDRLLAEEAADFEKAMEMQLCHHKRRGSGGGGSNGLG